MKKAKWLAVAVLLGFCTQVWAQSPELASHRLYFSALAANLGPNGEETPALEAYLNDAHISKDEHQKVVTALSIYKNRFDALVESYNNSPATKAWTNDETTVFLIKRDLVVQIAIEELKVALSMHNINELEGRIAFWGEKNHVNDLSESTEVRHPHLMPTQINMGPHYNYYHVQSTSTDSSGNMTAYTTAEVQGYANCGGCFVYHTPKIYNSLGGGGWLWGQSVTPPTYINMQNPQSFYEPASCFYGMPGVGQICNDESWTEISEVNCSSGWSWAVSFKWTLEAAVTFSQVTGWQNGSTAVLQDWCQLQYEPPDYNPTFLLNAQQGATYVLGGALCFNSTWSSGFWLCSPGIATSLTGTYTRKYCTHNIPPY